MEAVQVMLGDTLAEVPPLLSQAYDVYNKLPVELLLIGHCLCAASQFRKLRDRFLLSYWTTFMAAFAGGVLSSVLVMDRHASPQALFTVDAIFKIFTLSWWAINYCPGDAVHRLYCLAPVRLLAKCCNITLRVGLIASRVDLAVKLFPGVVAAPLILGTVAGSAGKFVVDGIMTVAGDNKGPTEISVPGYVWRSGCLAASVYWGLVHMGPAVLSPEQGKALLVVWFLAHGLLQDLIGGACDYTSAPFALFFLLTNIPRPGAVPATAAANGGATTSSKKNKAA